MSELRFEVYLIKLPDFYRLTLSRFRLGSSKLSVERGRYQNVERSRRFRNLCSNDKIGDEFHLLLECDNPSNQQFRKKYLPNVCQTNANVIKLSSLLNLQCVAKLTGVARYLA